jgi:hypothetical protein
MKITYTPNPLNTIVELEEHEQRELWHNIRFNEMLDMLFSVHYEVAYKKEPDINRIKKEVEPDYYLNEKDGEKTPLDKRCDELLVHFLEELKGSHIGDCTCFAMSCSKCHAESKLGIDTIKGLGKTHGHKIQSAFSYKEGDVWKGRSLDEALAILGGYDPKQTDPNTDPAWAKVEGYEAQIPRWKAEAKAAYDWLLAYRNEHFPTGDGDDTRH